MVREDNLEPGLRHFQYAQPGHVPFPLKIFEECSGRAPSASQIATFSGFVRYSRIANIELAT